LSRVYISLDIETTGLNPETDEIIEVGAVRFKGDRVLETYNQLVRPVQPIPYKIQQLTGIKPADVVGAPPIGHILPDLQRFGAIAPSLATTLSLTWAFCANITCFKQNEAIDTFELASILLPHASRYSLTALVDYLGITPPDGQAHRALDDSQSARLLFEALLDQARRLDSAVIDEIARIAAKTAWPLGLIFKDLSRERRHFGPVGSLGQQLTAKGFMGDEGGLTLIQHDPHRRPDPPLKPVANPAPLPMETLCHMLESGGLFEKSFAGFEHRSQQVDMMAHLIGAFNQAEHTMIEAGTGTGKSLAYLIPAIYWAVQNGERVVISTNTINLQDQLLNKDIPMLQKILPIEFKAVALKGRSNYVCPRRVQMFQAKESHNPRELRLLAKLMVWMPSTTTGDREEIFMPDYVEQAAWSQVASDGTICQPRHCGPDTCFYARARREAESAHVIIVNHALLLADVGVDNKIIPEYKYLIIDEAHHLEDSVTNQLSFTLDQKTTTPLLRELSQSPRGSDHRVGFIREVGRRCQAAVPSALQPDVADIETKSHEALEKLTQSARQLFAALQSFLTEFPGSRTYNPKIRLTEEVRSHPAWSNVELSWDNLDAGLKDSARAMGILHTMLTEMECYDVADWEELLANLAYYRGRLDEIRSNLKTIIASPNADRILWVEQDAQNQEISLHNAPLHVGGLVQEFLIKPKKSVVFTSATLRTNNAFDYFQERLEMWDATEAAVGSPFDYERNTLLYLPLDIPEPNTPNYQRGSNEALIKLVKQIRGRTLVLFTAYTQLRQAAEALKGPLAKAGIVHSQPGDGSSRRQMIENFKNSEQAELLGTRSFWEGVDIPGPALSCVVITRIPFAVPTDPIVSARAETFDDAFNHYSVPQAILMFRQGFGRLIRTQTDRGVVVIFDKRITSKGYGQAFIDSLPTLTERRGSLDSLPGIAENWIDYGGV
jgi:DNA polymerase-3 subunit epsilon/ATP-dependent DNA helicase DinG